MEVVDPVAPEDARPRVPQHQAASPQGFPLIHYAIFLAQNGNILVVAVQRRAPLKIISIGIDWNGETPTPVDIVGSLHLVICLQTRTYVGQDQDGGTRCIAVAGFHGLFRAVDEVTYAFSFFWLVEGRHCQLKLKLPSVSVYSMIPILKSARMDMASCRIPVGATRSLRYVRPRSFS